MLLRLSEQLSAIEAAGTFKKERVITSPMEPRMRVKESELPVLNFCANNYLGLSNHPRLVEAAKRTLDSHGLGMSSVRFICGTQDIHKELEMAISAFHGTEDTILYPSCFDANAGFFETILGEEDAVLSDALNHASIIDGIRLCKAKRYRYAHLDMEDLELKLIEAQGARSRLIATDGAFSMDGDVAPLDEICALAAKYDAQVFVDECHATGFVGPTGVGTPEHFGVIDKVDVINSTLGKALGGATGGYSTGRKEIVSLLRQRARPYLFSNSMAPCVVGASIEVFRMLSEGEAPVQLLQSRAKKFRSDLQAAGFTVTGADNHPIVPVMVGDARLASEFADELLARGIYVIGFSYPVVPLGAARIRTQLSAAHSEEDIAAAVDAFVSVGRAKGII
jgi:glycine C-acetyltransferase